MRDPVVQVLTVIKFSSFFIIVQSRDSSNCKGYNHSKLLKNIMATVKQMLFHQLVMIAQGK